MHGLIGSIWCLVTAHLQSFLFVSGSNTVAHTYSPDVFNSRVVGFEFCLFRVAVNLCAGLDQKENEKHLLSI